jgi:hypothetical protein
MASRTSNTTGAVATFENRLSADSRLALSEGSLFFEGKGAVQEALRKIAKRLNELGIPYAVAGGMALFHHGYRRFTEDVDILVTPDALRIIHKALDGLGYVRPFAKSKNLRDTDAGVKIEFLLTGGFPGDGKPKPVRFPDPQAVAVEGDGIRFINLSTLIELKLASGTSGTDRMKDLADVQELIKLLRLPDEMTAQLNPSVRDKYLELWRGAHGQARRFVRICPNASGQPVSSLEQALQMAVNREPTLEAMHVDGVVLDAVRSTVDELYLVTTDEAIGRKYGMEAEEELFDDCDDRR